MGCLSELDNTEAITKILATYTLEQILEWNELTEEDVLHVLLQHRTIEIPYPHPVDFDLDD